MLLAIWERRQHFIGSFTEAGTILLSDFGGVWSDFLFKTKTMLAVG